MQCSWPYGCRCWLLLPILFLFLYNFLLLSRYCVTPFYHSCTPQMFVYTSLVPHPPLSNGKFNIFILIKGLHFITSNTVSMAAFGSVKILNSILQLNSREYSVIFNTFAKKYKFLKSKYFRSQKTQEICMCNLN